MEKNGFRRAVQEPGNAMAGATISPPVMVEILDQNNDVAAADDWR